MAACYAACVARWHALRAITAFDWFRVCIGPSVLFAAATLMVVTSAPGVLHTQRERVMPPLPMPATHAQHEFVTQVCARPVIAAHDVESLIVAHAVLDPARRVRARYALWCNGTVAQCDTMPYFVECVARGPERVFAPLLLNATVQQCVIAVGPAARLVGSLQSVLDAVEFAGGVTATVAHCARDTVCVYAGGAPPPLIVRALQINASALFAQWGDADIDNRTDDARRVALGWEVRGVVHEQYPLPFPLSATVCAAVTVLAAGLTGVLYVRFRARMSQSEVRALTDASVPAPDSPDRVMLLSVSSDDQDDVEQSRLSLTGRSPSGADATHAQ